MGLNRYLSKIVWSHNIKCYSIYLYIYINKTKQYNILNNNNFTYNLYLNVFILTVERYDIFFFIYLSKTNIKQRKTQTILF